MSDEKDDLIEEDKYASQVLVETDVLNDRDLDINPNQYIHMAIQRSQIALLNPNIEAGMTQYIFLIEQMEMICRSAGLIAETIYMEKIDEFKKKEEYVKQSKELVKMMSLAQEKLRLMLSEVFGNKTSYAPLKM